MEHASIRVVDGDDSFRTSVIRILRATGLTAVGYRSGSELLAGDLLSRPGCFLLDVSRVELLELLVVNGAAPPVILVTGLDDVPRCVDAMKSGALDYIIKPVIAEHLLAAVRRALKVDAERRMAQSELDQLQQRFATLTNDERIVFRGVVRHRPDKQLADDLHSSERTIKARRARVMGKLQVSSETELARAARLLNVDQERG
jgi:FixJ family two-component response regulator